MTDPQPQPAPDSLAISEHYGPQSSEHQSKILPALFAFQQAVAPIAKDQVNDHLHTKYTDLTGVWAAIREPLKLHELLVIQENVPCSRGAMVVTTLVHMPSKEWRSSTIYVPARKADAQAFGSAISYARRYGLMTVLGLLTTDDDGHAATVPPVARTPGPQEYHDANVDDADRKGFEAWAQGKALQIMGCETIDALTLAWSGMQPELKKAPSDIRVKLTENKDARKTALAAKAGAIGDDVPF